MSTTTSKKYLFSRRIFFTLAAGIFLFGEAGAQTAKRDVEGRWLFIFDTSAEMKPRIKATQYEVNNLFSTAMSGQMRMDDSIGVWTFDEQLHTGGFPLNRWSPEDAWMLASNINVFIGKQHYANTTRLDVIPPMLNQVVKNSQRLTVLIFCDGEGVFNWTPYASGVNDVFQKWKTGQQKARQPFVVVLRSQAGQYIGCTVNFPPGAVKLLPFPPLPVPAPANIAPASSPPQTNKPPMRMIAPLIVVGTKIETNWPPPPKPAPTNTAPMTTTNVALPATANLVEPTNSIAPANAMTAPPPAVVITNAETNRAPPEIMSQPAKPQPTNVVATVETKATSPPITNPVTPAVAPASPAAPTNFTLGRTEELIIGVALLLVAGVVAAVFIFRSRRDRGSLISRSMRKP